ncbi:MAG: c-type cytochrome [Cocleimonas sp.]|nr:c-type cytochrome [Cocleimonas sp.]
MSNHAPKVDPIAKIIFIISLLAIVAVVYVLLSSLVSTYKRNSIKGEIDTSHLVMKVEENLQPIGTSATSDAPAVSAASAPARSGKAVYDAVCMACHATGAAGAPKLDDKAVWEPRVATGLDALMNTAINGKGAMPARGGQNVGDAELKAAILYMTKEAGFDLGAAAPATAEVPKQEEAAKQETPKKEEPKAEESTPATADVIPTEATAPEAPEATTPPVEATAPVVAASTSTPAASLETGKNIYNTACFACHATGVAGSPKLGDKEAWAPRIATGMEALYTTSLNGKGAMPPKGGNMALEDDDVKAAVDYMVNAAK